MSLRLLTVVAREVAPGVMGAGRATEREGQHGAWPRAGHSPGRPSSVYGGMWLGTTSSSSGGC